MTNFYDKLRPKNHVEVIALVAVVASAFSGLALTSFTFGNRVISLEPHIIGLALSGLAFVFLYHFRLLRLAVALPWRWLSLWFVLGFSVAALRTTSLRTTVFYMVYAGALYATLLGLHRGFTLSKIRRQWLVRIILTTSLGLAFVALAQFVIGSLSDLPLLREAYRVGVFSFPRVHGFSFEPLFFANWLLPAFFYFMLSKQRSLGYGILFAVVILLALARGAIYAIAAVLALYLFINRLNWRSHLAFFAKTMTAALAIALVMIGTSSAFNNSTFINGIGRYLDHASLGLFNYQGSRNTKPKIVYIDGERYEIYSNTEETDREGVVEASTFGRLEFIRLGKDILDEDPTHIAVGVGLHRFGQEAHELAPGVYTEQQVSNNQYVEVLVETGIIGLGLLALFFCMVVRWRPNPTDRWMYWTLIAMFIQFLFYSNYLLLMPWLIVLLLLDSTKRKRADG